MDATSSSPLSEELMLRLMEDPAAMEQLAQHLMREEGNLYKSTLDDGGDWMQEDEGMEDFPSGNGGTQPSEEPQMETAAKKKIGGV